MILTIIKTRKLGKEIAKLLGMSYATYRKRITGVKYYAPIPEEDLLRAAVAILEEDLRELKGCMPKKTIKPIITELCQ